MKSVYVMLFRNGAIKIGVSGSVRAREHQIKCVTALGDPVCTYSTGLIEDHRGIEEMMHRKFRGSLIAGMGREFFCGLDFDHVVEVLGGILERRTMPMAFRRRHAEFTGEY